MLVEWAQGLLFVDLVCRHQRAMAQRHAFAEGCHEMLQAEEDCVLKLGFVVLEGKRGNVVARGKYRTGLRLMALGAVAAADIDAFGSPRQVLHVPMSSNRVEMLEPGRIFNPKGGILAGPVVVAKLLERKVQMFDVLRENTCGVTYEDQYGFLRPNEPYL
jgi:hypothetical protein